MRDISSLLPPGTRVLLHSTPDNSVCFRNDLIVAVFLDPREVDDPSISDHALAKEILNDWRIAMLQKADELSSLISAL